MNIVKQENNYIIRFGPTVDVSLMNCYRRLLAQKAYFYGVTNLVVHEYHHYMPLDWFEHRIKCIPFSHPTTMKISIEEGSFILNNTLITTLRDEEIISVEITIGELEAYQAEAVVFNPSLQSDKRTLTIESLVDFCIDEIVKKRIAEVTKEIQTVLESLKINF